MRISTSSSEKRLERYWFVGHVREIQYPEWLANVVLVKKANGKWIVDLKKACPKDSYPYRA